MLSGVLADLVDDLVDLVWPRTCAGCAAPRTVLCATCRGRWTPAVLDDLTAGPPDAPVVAGAAYGAGLRRALIAYKERGRRELARPLGEVLRTAVDALLSDVAGVRAGATGATAPGRAPPRWSGVLVVPLPSTPAAARRRGGQHVAALATVAGRPRHARTATLLRTRAAGADSSELGAAGRVAVRDRFRTRLAPVDAPPVVVVDDIATTGATARDAVAALRRAGWPVLGVAVVAATPRPAPRLPSTAERPAYGAARSPGCAGSGGASGRLA